MICLDERTEVYGRPKINAFTDSVVWQRHKTDCINEQIPFGMFQHVDGL